MYSHTIYKTLKVQIHTVSACTYNKLQVNGVREFQT